MIGLHIRSVRKFLLFPILVIERISSSFDSLFENSYKSFILIKNLWLIHDNTFISLGPMTSVFYLVRLSIREEVCVVIHEYSLWPPFCSLVFLVKNTTYGLFPLIVDETPTVLWTNPWRRDEGVPSFQNSSNSFTSFGTGCLLCLFMDSFDSLFLSFWRTSSLSFYRILV